MFILALPIGRGWERSEPSRQDRIARDERRELVRSAMRSTAVHGHYVFEGLMTEEAGMIDFLTVGPMGICVVVMRDEEGDVTADVDKRLYLNGQLFADDPHRQAEDFVKDVKNRTVGDSVAVHDVLCFTRAEIFYLGENEDVLRGVYPTWDLPLAFAEAPEEHTPADVAETADRVREAYGRPPFIVPKGTDAP